MGASGSTLPLRNGCWTLAFLLAAGNALLLGCNTALAQPSGAAGIRVGPLLVYPGVDLAIGHNDNLFYSNTNRQSSSFTSFSPYIIVEGRPTPHKFDLLFRGESVRYYQSTADSTETFTLLGNAALVFTGRAGLKLRAEHKLGVDPRGSTDRLISTRPDEWTNDSLDGTFSYGAPGAQGRIEVDAGVGRRRYENNRIFTAEFDRDTSALGGTFFWRVGPRTELLFQAQRAELDYTAAASTLDSTEERFYVGVKWAATAKTTGTAKFGHLRKDFMDSTRQDFSGSSWDVGLRWSPLTYSVVDFVTSKQAQESTGLGDAVVSKFYGATWSHAWSSRVRSQVLANWRKDDYIGFNRNDDTSTLGFKADYAFRRWLRFGAEYTWTDRSSNVNAFDYRRNLLLFTVGATL